MANLRLLRSIYPYLFLFAILSTNACRKDPNVLPITPSSIGEGLDKSEYAGLYLLNEGNMGSNKASLDYLDFASGTYLKNIYPTRNPNVAMELGDVGNDIGIYGSKLFLVINASNKVEVLQASNAKRIGHIDIPNCRSLLFHGGNAYVTSFISPIQIDPDSPRGALFRIDTASLEVTGKVEVGYQPEEMATDGKSIFVANSGGYRQPHYDNTISVVDIQTFHEVEKIPVALNLHHIKRDHYDQLWVSSRGDYKEVPSSLVLLQRDKEKRFYLVDTLPIPCSNFAIKGDSLFYYAIEESPYSSDRKVSYGIVNIKSRKVVTKSFLKPHPEVNIETPYGIAIYGCTGDILITDAKGYTSSGTLYCFSSDGSFRWKVTTGDIPGHIAFLPKNLATRETISH